MSNDKTREEFEAWCMPRGFSTGKLGCGTYANALTLSAWEAWQAALAAQPATVPDEEVMKLLSAVKYIIGIAERGEGRAMREDESVESFVLGYVKRLEAIAAQPATVPEEWHRYARDVASVFKDSVGAVRFTICDEDAERLPNGQSRLYTSAEVSRVLALLAAPKPEQSDNLPPCAAHGGE